MSGESWLEEIAQARTALGVFETVASMVNVVEAIREPVLAAWMANPRGVPAGVQKADAKQLTKLVDTLHDSDGWPLGEWSWSVRHKGAKSQIEATMRNEDGVRICRSFDDVHAAWASLSPSVRKKLGYPFWAHMREWHKRSGTLFTPIQKCTLPGLHRPIGDRSDLPNVQAVPKQTHFVDIPGGAAAAEHCPSWLLRAFGISSALTPGRGSGAPWALRIFIGVMLHVHRDDRNGVPRNYAFTVFPDPDLPNCPSLIDWLFPGKRRWKNKKRDWHKLSEAMRLIKNNMANVRITGADKRLYSVDLIHPTITPDSKDANLALFTVCLPAESKRGVGLDWPTLCEYGVEGAGIYRTYLSAMAYMDKSAHNGHPITEHIAAPLLTDEGKPKRRKGGKVVRSKTEVVPNKAAKFVTVRTSADLALSIGLEPNKKNRHRAVKWYERLHADGKINLVPVPGGWRLFGPGP